MKSLIVPLFMSAGLLMACQTEDVPILDMDNPTERLACEDKGGKFMQAGLSGNWVCVLPTKDAGKSCKTNSDCSGFCMAETRSCSPVTPFYGCHDVLIENGQQATICVD